MKSVIFVPNLVPRSITMPHNVFGLGDQLKGLIFTYDLCRKHNIDFYVDFRFHPIGKFVKSQAHPFESEIVENKIPFIMGKDVEAFILNNGGLICFLTNGIPHQEITLSESCKEFCKQLLRPINELVDRVEEISSKHNCLKIFHLRFGDKECVDHEPQSKEKYLYYINKYKNELKQCNFLMSDSLNFKKLASQATGIDFLPHKPQHLGSLSLDHSSIFNDFLDFFLLTRASFIFSLTSEGHCSSFSLVPSKIFDIQYRCKTDWKYHMV
tara:strand:- start:4025 stop:4828 length:804 start_codon:yes stop_codon:yes gene_type:complete